MKRKIQSKFALLFAFFSVFSAAGVGHAEEPAPQAVWTENFDQMPVGSALLDNCDQWEYAGTNSEKLKGAATIQGDEKNRYLQIELENPDREDVATGGYYVVSSKKISQFGLEENADFTVSYDLKFAPYDEATGAYNNKFAEYYYGLADSASGIKAYSTLYAYQVVNQNDTSTPTFYTDVVESVAPEAKLYLKTWNTIQYVVHASPFAGESTADLYVNGIYCTTVQIRGDRDEFVNRISFGINLNPGITAGKMYVDNIRLQPGSFPKQEYGDHCAVNVLDVDFTGMEAAENGDADISVLPPFKGNKLALGNDSANTVFESVKGVFGKAANDTSLHIYNTVPGGSVNNDANLTATLNTDISLLHNPGEKQEISFSFAFEETEVMKAAHVAVTTKAYINGVETKYLNTFYITPDRVELFNGAYRFHLQAPLSPEKMYQFRAIITAGDGAGEYNKISLYLDNTPVVDTITGETIVDWDIENLGETMFGGVSQLWLHYQMKTYTQLSGVYFDDVKIVNYLGNVEPETERVVPKMAAKVDKEKYVTRGVVFTGEDTIKQVIENFSEEELLLCQMRTPAGQDIIDQELVAAGNYGAIVAKDGSCYYVKFEGTQQILKLTEYAQLEDAPLTEKSIENGTMESAVKYAGRSAGDESILVEPTQADSGAIVLLGFQETAVRQYTNPSCYKPMTAEFSILLSDESEVHLEPYVHAATYLANSADYRGPRGGVHFKNGKIYMRSLETEPIASYEPGQWIKVSITTYPGTALEDITINGVTYKEETGIYRYAVQYVSKYKLTVRGQAVLDDIQVSTGRYTPLEGPKAQPTGEETVATQKNILFAEDIDTSVSSLTDYVSLSGIPAALYQEGTDMTTCESDATQLSEGAVLVLYESGIYRYYTLRFREDGKITILKEEDGFLAAAESSSQKNCMWIAEYEQDRLTGVSLVSGDAALDCFRDYRARARKNEESLRMGYRDATAGSGICGNKIDPHRSYKIVNKVRAQLSPRAEAARSEKEKGSVIYG